LRILAHLADIKLLKEAFLQKTDVHTATASKIFGIAADEVTPSMRGRAKTINFGILYGMSAFRLSKTLEISVHEAKQYIESYFANFPEFESYHKHIMEFARSRGYVETFSGRRCYIKDVWSKNFALRQFSERQAFNAVVQGSAADIVKIAMIQLQLHLKDLHASLLLQIHDELVFEVDENFVEQAETAIKSIMESCVSLSVPLEVDAEIGDYLQ
jgi:DNA polymerase-1